MLPVALYWNQNMFPLTLFGGQICCQWHFSNKSVASETFLAPKYVASDTFWDTICCQGHFLKTNSVASDTFWFKSCCLKHLEKYGAIDTFLPPQNPILIFGLVYPSNPAGINMAHPRDVCPPHIWPLFCSCQMSVPCGPVCNLCVHCKHEDLLNGVSAVVVLMLMLLHVKVSH